MATVLVFRYDCGWEHNVRLLAGQSKAQVIRRLGPEVRRKHKRACGICFRKRSRQVEPHPD
jgi:hypothetical protein